MPVTIYGIKNCDTMKKARAWLDANGVAYAFHDYKTQGLDEARLQSFIDALGWEPLLNRAAPPSAPSPTPTRPTSTRKRRSG